MFHPRLLTSIVAAFVLLNSTEARAVPLSEEKITALMKAKVPDAVIAKEIQASGLAFKVSSGTLARLKAAGAGPVTLNALVGAFSKLQVAKVEIPKLLSQVFTALDEGEPTRVEKYFDKFDDPGAVYNMIMKPYSYVGHYIERITELPPTTIRSYGGYRAPKVVKPGPSFFAVVRTLDKANNETELHLYFTASISRPGSAGLIISNAAIPNVGESIVWGEAERNSAVNAARNFIYAIIAGNNSKVETLLWPGAKSDEIPGAIDCFGFIQNCKTDWNAFGRVDNYDLLGANGLKHAVTLRPKDEYCTNDWLPKLVLSIENIGGEMRITEIDHDRLYVPGKRCEIFVKQSDPDEITRLQARFAKFAGKLVSDVKEKP